MSETTTTVQNTLPAAIVGKFNIALTQSKFQLLTDKANALVFNEDNLPAIRIFLDDMRAVKKAIIETHKEGKSEALKVGQQWDSVKRSFEEMVSDIEEKPQHEYTRLCEEVATRKREQEYNLQRIKNIKTGIETNAISFAKTISECTTSQQLTNIERNINLEKTRKEKYMEFLDDAVSRYSELNSLLKSQKETVKQLEENIRQQEEASKRNDDAELLRLQEEQAQQEAKIEEAKITVQEIAINQSLKEEIQIANEVLPEIKARRTSWEWEVINEKEVMNKSPELVVFSLDKEKIKANLKLLKDSHQLDGKTELIINGIKYFETKTY